MSGGVLLIVAGMWIIFQVTAGNLVGRLGLVKSP